MDKWQELTVEIGREAQEAVSHILVEAGAGGVAIEDSADYSHHEDYFGEVLPQVVEKETVKVTAYYPEGADLKTVFANIKEKISHLSDYGLAIGETSYYSAELEEEDWSESWKKYYEPTRITRDLTIVPSWTDYQGESFEKCIYLDPGMAFGTGTHPTTKLSLFALEQILRGGESVIDVGTGSGVLSVASSLLGAKEIVAYDVDDIAVKVAKDNIALNETVTNIEVEKGDLLRGVNRQADVIVANILADILMDLTDDAFRLLKNEGYLIMSGIIAEKWAMIQKQAEKSGFALETEMIQGEWHAGVFKKTDNLKGIVGG